jgi:16S rRNA (cytidine1402-2'-O)-methyltransferase
MSGRGGGSRPVCIARAEPARRPTPYRKFMSVLYIVSTPIGNLQDVTLRALEVLRTADRVLAEDTRRTATLFRRYDISTPLVSAHEHNEAARSTQLVGWLDAGETVALVSDAGTPLLSDPGERLVRAVLAAGHEVVPVPGASALLAALVGSGLAAEPFTFFGFAPRSGRARADVLGRVAALEHTAVLYESPARVGALLSDLLDRCDGERQCVVARELTKVHETFTRGTLASLASSFRDTTVRGEVVVMVGGAVARPASAEDAAALARSLLAAGESPRSAARELARRLRMSRNDAYSLVLELRGGEG